ncbi:MAG: SNF2-related protein [Terriglobia bacterium]
MNDVYKPAQDLVLGTKLNCRVPQTDQIRQKMEVSEVLKRLRTQPGVVLGDEVGMGKTFVALAVAYSVAIRSPRGPVIVLVPANLVDKWEQDLNTFCELYLENRYPVRKDDAERQKLIAPSALRYGVARHSVDLMKLLDDPARERCHFIFLAQGAMGRRQTDKWVRLALIAEALRRHGRGGSKRLIQVRKCIHRYLAELIWAIGEQRAHSWGEELWQELLWASPLTWRQIYNNAVRDEGRMLADDPVPKSVIRTLQRTWLSPLADALREMPVRAVGGDAQVSKRLNKVRGPCGKLRKTFGKECWPKLGGAHPCS